MRYFELDLLPLRQLLLDDALGIFASSCLVRRRLLRLSIFFVALDNPVLFLVDTDPGNFGKQAQNEEAFLLVGVHFLAVFERW